jgi:hypothetical protein
VGNRFEGRGTPRAPQGDSGTGQIQVCGSLRLLRRPHGLGPNPRIWGAGHRWLTPVILATGGRGQEDGG